MPFLSFYKAKYKLDAQDNGELSINCVWVYNQVILISVHDIATM